MIYTVTNLFQRGLLATSSVDVNGGMAVVFAGRSRAYFFSSTRMLRSWRIDPQQRRRISRAAAERGEDPFEQMHR